MDLYIMDAQRKPVRELDHDRWVSWMRSSVIRVAATATESCLIVTMFTGLDLVPEAHPTPMLWQTALSDNDGRILAVRSCAGSVEQAEAMHQQTVEMIERAENLLELAKAIATIKLN